MEDFDFLADAPKQVNDNTSNNDSQDGYKKQYKKSNNPNKVSGINEIDLWKDDKVEPLAIDTSKFKTDKKYVTISLPNNELTLQDGDKDKIGSVLKKLKDKDYKVRFICNYIQPIYKATVGLFGMDNILHITLWRTYCKNKIDATLYTPSDLNIRTAAEHIKNFGNLAPVIKYKKAGLFTTLFGWYNNEPSAMFITFDPYYNGKDFDFKKSRDTADYYIVCKQMGIPVYNISNDSAYADVLKVLE